MLVNVDLFQSFQNQSFSQPLAREVEDLLTKIGLQVVGGSNLPQRGSLLIIANHPTGFLDVLMILSLLPRNDVQCLVQANYAQLSGEMAKHLLPVYLRRRKRDILFKLFFSELQQHTAVIDDETLRREKNKQTISQAARYLNSGGVVIIFPTGTGGKNTEFGEWKPGVGFLAKQALPQTKVVFAEIKGGRPQDEFRLLNPSILRWLFSPKVVTLTFSPAQKLADLCDLYQDGKTISRQLENKYEKVYG